MISHTRLRWASSEDALLLNSYVNALPYKIEIKSISHDGQKWFCWFVLPESENLKEVASGDLD